MRHSSEDAYPPAFMFFSCKVIIQFIIFITYTFNLRLPFRAFLQPIPVKVLDGQDQLVDLNIF